MDLAARIFALLSVVVLTTGIFMAFIYAPTDRVQGHAQRIVYVHAPMAWLAYMSAFFLFIGSVGYLWKRSMSMDRLGRSAAELGLLFTTLALITGSIWGRPIWGTWWEWDARLTTTLILWFIYLGYFMVRAYAGDRERGARYAAVLGIIGMIDVPIIHMSVTWWRTLHPEPVVISTAGPSMPDSMLITLLVCFIGFTLLFGHLLIQRIQIEAVRDALDERELESMLSTTTAERQRRSRTGSIGAESTSPVKGT
jgi:heme exporter protein C